MTWSRDYRVRGLISFLVLLIVRENLSLFLFQISKNKRHEKTENEKGPSVHVCVKPGIIASGPSMGFCDYTCCLHFSTPRELSRFSSSTFLFILYINSKCKFTLVFPSTATLTTTQASAFCHKDPFHLKSLVYFEQKWPSPLIYLI